MNAVTTLEQQSRATWFTMSSSSRIHPRAEANRPARKPKTVACTWKDKESLMKNRISPSKHQMSWINLFEGEISNDQVPPFAWRVHSANIHLPDRYSSVENVKHYKQKFNKRFVQTATFKYFSSHHDKQHVMQRKESLEIRKSEERFFSHLWILFRDF